MAPPWSFTDLTGKTWRVIPPISGTPGVASGDTLEFLTAQIKKNSSVTWGVPGVCTAGNPLNLDGTPSLVGTSFQITYAGTTLTGRVYQGRTPTEIGSWTATDSPGPHPPPEEEDEGVLELTGSQQERGV